jgi:hypothetical protein
MAARKPSEHDVVALLVDAPDHGLSAGDTGTVIHCYKNAEAYEVEFLDASGRTRAIATLEASQLLKLNLSPVAAP